MRNKTYSELSKLKTFKERFNYLKLDGNIGEDTFGFDRFINQKFYQSEEWKKIRDYVIARDNGCDLGLYGYEIFGKRNILIHHMNPITKEDIINMSEYVLNPEYLITVTKNTHNAIHYGDYEIIESNQVIERSPNDTCPWKHK